MTGSTVDPRVAPDGARAWPLRGLRLRLVVAFAMLGFAVATGVAGVEYITARDAIVQRAQDIAVARFLRKVESLRPLPVRSEPELLSFIGARMGIGTEHQALVLRGDGRSSDGFDQNLVAPQLRDAAAAGYLVSQRVRYDDATWLVTGVQLSMQDATGPPADPSARISVFVLDSLAGEEAVVDDLARDAWLVGAAGVAVALGLAMFAARGVVRPVRALQQTAARLGAGDLEARAAIPPGGDELAAVSATFNEMADSLRDHVVQLRRMETDARRFVGDVSHELRTPLTAMTAVLDLLDDTAEQLPQDAARAVRLIGVETRSLTRLVEDLIEVTRFDAGTAALRVDTVDVAEAIRATLDRRGLVVDTDLPDGVEAVLDPRRLDVIVANLVGNAVRHGAPPVLVTASATADTVTVQVIDSGPGIDESSTEEIFDRFVKADQSRSRSEGSGLGLAIARENAHLHGGTLTAANGPDGGAVFTLRLPRFPDGRT